MTYPASPGPGEVGPNRVRLNNGQFWAGAVATAVVAALIALVGILICRWTLNIPILAPAGSGAWGDAHTAEYALVAALVALIAAGLLYLLVLSTPQPTLFFDWILGLATLAAVVYPFSTSAPLNQKAATAIVNLILGIAITSLLTTVARRAIRRPLPRYVRREYVSGSRYGPGYAPDDRYAAGRDYRSGRPAPPPERPGPPAEGPIPPTEPLNVPPERDPRLWE